VPGVHNDLRHAFKRLVMISTNSRKVALTAACYAMLGHGCYSTDAQFVTIYTRQAMSALSQDEVQIAINREYDRFGDGHHAAAEGGADVNHEEAEQQQQQQQQDADVKISSSDDDDDSKLQDIADDIEEAEKEQEREEEQQAEFVITKDKSAHRVGVLLSYEKRHASLKHLCLAEFAIAIKEVQKSAAKPSNNNSSSTAQQSVKVEVAVAAAAAVESESESDSDSESDDDVAARAAQVAAVAAQQQQQQRNQLIDDEDDVVPPAQQEQQQQRAPAAQHVGRGKNARFPLHAAHPFFNERELMVVSKGFFPSLGGQRPPLLPDANDKSREAAQMRQEWAWYWAINLIPWTAAEPCWKDATYASMLEYVSAGMDCVDGDLSRCALCWWCFRCTTRRASKSAKRFVAAYQRQNSDIIRRKGEADDEADADDIEKNVVFF
jgi:hypothetical protein